MMDPAEGAFLFVVERKKKQPQNTTTICPETSCWETIQIKTAGGAISATERCSLHDNVVGVVGVGVRSNKISQLLLGGCSSGSGSVSLSI